MEFWDIYDKDRLPTGRKHPRGKKLQQGDYHVVIHVCIFNSLGQMLIQQRQPFKKGWSNMWDVTVGGSAVAGDTSQMAAHRELLEELGFDYDFSNMRPQITINFADGFNDVYLVTCDLDEAQLKLQYDEVQRVKWANCDEILQLIDAGKFIPYRKSWIQFLFESNCQYGTHSKKDPT